MSVRFISAAMNRLRQLVCIIFVLWWLGLIGIFEFYLDLSQIRPWPASRWPTVCTARNASKSPCEFCHGFKTLLGDIMPIDGCARCRAISQNEWNYERTGSNFADFCDCSIRRRHYINELLQPFHSITLSAVILQYKRWIAFNPKIIIALIFKEAIFWT